MITDLHELQHLADPSNRHAHYYRMLAPRYYTSCGALERESLFSHSSLILASEVPHQTMDMAISSIVEYLLHTFLVEVDPSSIELRFADLDGDVFQVSRTTNLIDLLDGECPMWRSSQPDFFGNTPIPSDIDFPFVARFSCHPFDPRVILP